MKKLSPIGLFVILVIIIPVTGYALFSMYEKNWARLPILGMTEEVNGQKTAHHIGDFQLVNQNGQVITTDNWTNKIVIADFFFTHCASICPKMTNSLKKVSRQFREDEGVLINSFSVDPERDSVAQLKKYEQRFGITTSNWDLLTGDKKVIYRLARNGFMIVATDGDGGPNDFIHSEKLVLIDTHKRVRGYYDGTNEKEVDQLINDIKKLKHES